MKKELKEKILALVVIKLLIVFLIMALLIHNIEFVFYDILLLILTIVAYIRHRRIHLSTLVLAMIAMAFVLHAAGGVVHIGGVRLYDVTFGPIPYDKILHFTSSLTASLVVYSMLHRAIGRAWEQHPMLALFMMVVVTAGLGAFWEMVELAAVLTLDAGTAVGTYTNNALDLVANALGATVGALIVSRHHSKYIAGK